MNIGRALTIVRKERKLLQRQVAAAIGIHQRTYSRIECSTLRPDYPTFQAICKAMEVIPTDVYILAVEAGDFPTSRCERYAPAYRIIQLLIRDIIKTK